MLIFHVKPIGPDNVVAFKPFIYLFFFSKRQYLFWVLFFYQEEPSAATGKSKKAGKPAREPTPEPEDEGTEELDRDLMGVNGDAEEKNDGAGMSSF